VTRKREPCGQDMSACPSLTASDALTSSFRLRIATVLRQRHPQTTTSPTSSLILSSDKPQRSIQTSQQPSSPVLVRGRKLTWRLCRRLRGGDITVPRVFLWCLGKPRVIIWGSMDVFHDVLNWWSERDDTAVLDAARDEMFVEAEQSVVRLFSKFLTGRTKRSWIDSVMEFKP
jgi:hypothetical protein